MVANPKKAELQAFHQINTTPGLDVFKSYLHRALTELDENNRVQPNDVLLRQGQGASQTLASLIDTIERSTELLRGMK